MKKVTLLLVVVGIFAAIGCGKKEEAAADFKNDKPVPAEDGGGSAAAGK